MITNQYTIAVWTGIRGKKGRLKHGESRLTKKVQDLIEKKVEELILYRKVKVFILGGAAGSDTYVLQYTLQVRGYEKTPKLIVVVPVTIPFQPKETWAITLLADEVVQMRQSAFVGGRFQPKIYHNRNLEMVKYGIELAGSRDKVVLVAVWDGNKHHSGTYNTMKIAERRSIAVEDLYVL